MSKLNNIDELECKHAPYKTLQENVAHAIEQANRAPELLADNARLRALNEELAAALELVYDNSRLYRPEVAEQNIGEAARAALAKYKEEA